MASRAIIGIQQIQAVAVGKTGRNGAQVGFKSGGVILAGRKQRPASIVVQRFAKLVKKCFFGFVIVGRSGQDFFELVKNQGFKNRFVGFIIWMVGSERAG